MKSKEAPGDKTIHNATRSKLPIKIQAVAFDMDGLLLNTEDLYEEVTHALLAKRGKVFKEEVRRRMIGLPAPKAYQVLIESESLEETWEQLQLESEGHERRLHRVPAGRSFVFVRPGTGTGTCGSRVSPFASCLDGLRLGLGWL